VEDLDGTTVCPTCQGTRLNATARAVKFAGVGIADIAALSVSDVRRWVEGLRAAGGMTQREADIARDLVPEIQSRLEFLEEVGLGYLTLDRGAPTLSGGEAQRIRLAAQLGSNLQGVCYVLDEPTIGLHARDNQILLLFSPIFTSMLLMGRPTDPMVNFSPLWSHDTVARLSVRP
jgi:excinuclease ABC subunit A